MISEDGCKCYDETIQSCPVHSFTYKKVIEQLKIREEECYSSIFDGTTSATTGTTSNTLTMDTLREIIEKIPKCPYKQFMEEKGSPPSDGWVMLLPLMMEDRTRNYPDYIIFTFAVPYDKIYFMKKDYADDLKPNRFYRGGTSNRQSDGF